MTVGLCCSLPQFAIEVDGGRQDFRDRWLEGKGIVVLLFWNNEVIYNPSGVPGKSRRAARIKAPCLPLLLSGRAAAELQGFAQSGERRS